MDLTQYREMAVGTKLPVVCCNPRKKSAVVFRDAGKISLWCSRCGKYESVHVKRALPGHTAMLEHVVSSTASIPPDTTHMLPHSALAWLNKYDISESARTKHSIGYSPSYDRVVLRAFGGVHGCQLRALDGKEPKYLTPNGTDKMYWAAYPEPFNPRNGYESRIDSVILVEDIVSGIKVSEAGFNTIAVLGTNISHEKVDIILRDAWCKRVFTWFDSDAAGDKARKQAKTRFELKGFPCTHIKTQLDPKCYSLEQIRTEVNTHVQNEKAGLCH